MVTVRISLVIRLNDRTIGRLYTFIVWHVGFFFLIEISWLFGWLVACKKKRMFLKNNDQGFLLIITDHDFAKSEREREIFLFIFKLLGLVSIEIFTGNLGNLCSLFLY